MRENKGVKDDESCMKFGEILWLDSGESAPKYCGVSLRFCSVVTYTCTEREEEVREVVWSNLCMGLDRVGN